MPQNRNGSLSPLKIMSGSSGRYQSRFFNFLSQKSRRVAETCDHAVRQLKVATVWGTQVFLYPIYAIFQTARLTGKQLKPPANEGKPLLQESTSSQRQEPPTVDTPLQKVLEATQTLSLPEDVATRFSPSAGNSALAVKPASKLNAAKSAKIQNNAGKGDNAIIHGVASLIATKSLVLVTVKNEVLDILTPPQQEKLRQRISWEVAHYCRYRKLAATQRQKNLAQLPPPEERANLALPVRVFVDVMAWVQSGPVAVAVNLFQEAALVLQPREREKVAEAENLLGLPAANLPLTPLPQSKIQDLKSKIHELLPDRAIVVVDRTVAAVETLSLPSVSALTIAFKNRSHGLLEQAKKPFIALVTDSFDNPLPAETEKSASLQNDPLKVQALIQAAVDYFFGPRGGQLTGEADEDWQLPAGAQIPENQLAVGNTRRQLPQTAQFNSEPDPWLSLGDLFGKPASYSTAGTSTYELSGSEDEQPNLALPFSPTKNVPVGKSIRNLAKRYLKRKSELVSQPQDTSSVTSTQTTSSEGIAPVNAKPATPTIKKQNQPLPAATSETPPTVAQLTSRRSSIQHTPDWIETHATSVGYVKHPLELLLEWLDRAMFWLEELALHIWKLWQQRRHN
ncbi:hypothetical protein [Microcoleus sp. FACHB-672]|uniref:hypothetical protein n=1 Tax=Microcoleus sp. FACHB-672 TaxID=2692825 RepID=UPI001682E4CB|nr:hypothetical protein [Microcoleus sp. FACHB-672]MBD2042321.1 hypothetical protein [Microcoleus sp. FACHB-672]